VTAIIQTVASVEPYGENLSIVTTSEGHKVIANKKEDGSFRWAEGELVAYVSEGSIIPDDVLKERGYWDHSEGLLDGGKRNRVKMKKLAGFESRGLLFKVRPGSFMGESIDFVDRENHPEGGEDRTGGRSALGVRLGDDVSAFLGITEFTG
jgi:hypothetical protein